MSLFEVDGKKNTEVMSSIELMQKANLALTDMGRAAAGAAPIMQAFGKQAERINYLVWSVVSFERLQRISGKSPEEIKEHLRYFTGSIFELESFYIRFGCFPRSCDTEQWGLHLMEEYQRGLKPIDADLILMEKSPRLMQGIFVLIMLAILMLLEAF